MHCSWQHLSPIPRTQSPLLQILSIRYLKIILDAYPERKALDAVVNTQNAKLMPIEVRTYLLANNISAIANHNWTHLVCCKHVVALSIMWLLSQRLISKSTLGSSVNQWQMIFLRLCVLIVLLCHVIKQLIYIVVETLKASRLTI